MKAKIYFIGFVLLFAFCAQAKHVKVENAQSVAEKYFSQKTDGVSLRSAQPSFYTLAYTAKKESSGVNLRSGQAGDEDAYFYIFNTPDGSGFIIIAADDRAYPVLGYSFKGAFDYDKAPPVFVQWLLGYQEEIEGGLKANPQLEANPEWQKIGDGITLHSAGATLGTAEWYQINPYNLQCPMFGGQRTITGCVATAMAIVMKYHADHGFAATGTGSHSYDWQGQTLTADFGTYEWTNMPNNYYGFTNDTQRNAVARLMSHCGISIEANYGVGGTLANPANIAKALTLFFGYDPGVAFLNRSAFTDNAWKDLIKTEIDNNRPVIYNGYGNEGGHAFVCEGYTVNDEYAINWGWDGYCNGFFRLNPLLPGNGYDFSERQSMIMGIKKGSGNVSDMNQIWLTSSGGGKGMSKSMENIEQNRQFTVTAGSLENISYNAFRGRIAVALTDDSGNIKEVIATPMDFVSNPLNPGYYYPSVQFTCNTTKTIAPSDLIRMVLSTDNEVTWKIIQGKTGAVDFLTVGVQNVDVNDVSLNSNAETLTVDGTFQLTATIAPENATNKNVTWTSSDTNVAEVNASGLVTAKATGTATITVTTVDGAKTATCTITVQAATVAVTGVTLNSHAETLTVDETFQLSATVAPDNATNTNVTWTSSNSNVAEVSASGLVTANAAGTATITVTTVDGAKTATCTITVQAATVAVIGVTLNSNAETLTVGGTIQLTATVAPDNATNTNVTWTSSNANVAEVSASGLVTAKAAGEAVIKVTSVESDILADSCLFTVIMMDVPAISIELNHTSWGLHIGETLQLQATILPEDANQNVTWHSTNTEKLTVSSDGLVTCVYNITKGSEIYETIEIIVTTSNGLKSSCYFYLYPENSMIYGTFYWSVSKCCTLLVGDTLQIRGYLYPENTHSNLWYYSDDHSIIKVDSISGIAIGNHEGSTVIGVMIDNHYIPNVNDNVSSGLVGNWGAGMMISVINNDLKNSEYGDITSVEYKQPEAIHAYIQNGILSVGSPESEQISIYSVTGSILYQAKKPAGAAVFKVGDLPKGFLIVRGSSGWVKKLIKN